MRQIRFNVDIRPEEKINGLFNFYRVAGKNDSDKWRNFITELHKRLDLDPTSQLVGVSTNQTEIAQDLVGQLGLEVEHAFEEQKKAKEKLDPQDCFYCVCASALQRYSEKRDSQKE